MEVDETGDYMKSKRTSQHQKRYISFINSNPGCSIADVNRACKFNKQAGHKWIYDSVNRLINRGFIKRIWKDGKTHLTIN